MTFAVLFAMLFAMPKTELSFVAKQSDKKQRVAARITAFIGLLARVTCAENFGELARWIGLENRQNLHALFRGSPDASARIIAQVCDAFGVNVARVILGPGGKVKRPFFIAPEVQHLDPDNAKHGVEVERVIVEAKNKLIAKWERMHNAA